MACCSCSRVMFPMATMGPASPWATSPVTRAWRVTAAPTSWAMASTSAARVRSWQAKTPSMPWECPREVTAASTSRPWDSSTSSTASWETKMPGTLIAAWVASKEISLASLAHPIGSKPTVRVPAIWSTTGAMSSFACSTSGATVRLAPWLTAVFNVVNQSKPWPENTNAKGSWANRATRRSEPARSPTLML